MWNSNFFYYIYLYLKKFTAQLESGVSLEKKDIYTNQGSMGAEGQTRE